MARQEIKLGEIWLSVFEKLNANFTELYNAQGDAVTSAELATLLESYVTTDALSTAIAEFVTENELNAALGGYVTAEAFAEELANYITSSALTTALANYVTNTALTTALANYVTSGALTTALANKVDKISGKDLSTNDYTTAEKSKLASLTAPTKHEFTANSWGTADADGVYSYAITSTQSVANVFRADGSTYENAAVAILVNGGTITLKSEEAFAGYAVLV